MKYSTKKARLLALFDAFYELNGKRAVTTTEVSEWAFKHGLYPVPKRGSSVKECFEWEGRLQRAIAADIRGAEERP